MTSTTKKPRLQGSADGVVGEIPVPSVGASPPFGLVTARQYQLDHPSAFPAFEALRWFLRRHRQALVAAGALCKWRGEVCLDVERFERVARDCVRLTIDR